MLKDDTLNLFQECFISKNRNGFYRVQELVKIRHRFVLYMLTFHCSRALALYMSSVLFAMNMLSFAFKKNKNKLGINQKALTLWRLSDY